MRIGLDARFLTHPQRGGFKTYTINLVDAITAIDDENTYILYVDRPAEKDLMPGNGNSHVRVVETRLPGVGMPLREQFFLRWQILKDKLDVVHFLCNTATTNLPRKYVLTLHDTIQLTSQPGFDYAKGLSANKRAAMTAYSRWVIERTARSASKIITVSTYEKSQIAGRLEIPPDMIDVTPLAPTAQFRPACQVKKQDWRNYIRERYGIQKRFILGVGYEPRKNIPLLVEAFSMLAPLHPDLELVIVAAEESSRNFFKQLASDCGVGRRVRILKALPPEELAILYNLTEVFAFPSERESFGLPPLEALACGAPVVAMAATSLPEILGDGALMVKGKNVEDWTHAIGCVITDENIRSNLVRKGLEQADKFSWEECARRTIEVYKAVAEENGRE